MPSNHLILCCLLLLLPSIFPSIRVFSRESVLHIRWPNYWNFSFCISPSNEYSGLISFRMDWLDLLAVQGTLKSLFQHSVQKHQVFATQLSLYFIFILYGREWKMKLRSIEEKRTKDHRQNLNERRNLEFSVAKDIGMSFY